jgi:hypothetical protein
MLDAHDDKFPDSTDRRFRELFMQPLLTAIEQALHVDDQLFPDKTLFPRFITNALLRPSLKDRADAYRLLRQGGILTANELRALEDYPERPDGDELQATPSAAPPTPRPPAARTSTPSPRPRRSRPMSRFIEELRSHIGPVSSLRAPLGDVEVRAAGGDGADSSDLIFTGHAAVFDVPATSSAASTTASPRRSPAARSARRSPRTRTSSTSTTTAASCSPARAPRRSSCARTPAASTSTRAPRRPRRQDLAIAMRAGNVKHMSFAFTTAEDHWEETTHEDGTVEAVRTVLKVERLYDTSPVGQPAYPRPTRRCALASSAASPSATDFPPPGAAGHLDELAQRVASTGEPDTEARQAGPA